MKSKHRHDLETNELARRLSTLIEDVRPYSSVVLGTLIAVVVVLMGWSYLSGSSAARREQAWAMYNVAVESGAPNLEMLRRSAEENPGTSMQEFADVTWADGQVFRASQMFIQNRTAADQALNGAESMYRSILGTSTNQRLLGRARFGLGRIYEMQNKLDQAREQYAAVEGDFAELAQARAKKLDEAQVKQACDWLAAAEPPPRVVPTGPGTPGQRPDFSATDMKLPSETSQGGATTGSMMEGLDLGIEETGDRYGQGGDDLFGAPSTDQPADGGPTDGTPNDGTNPQ